MKTSEIEKITKKVLALIKKLKKGSHETFYKKSQNVDEFIIVTNFLITFNTMEGYRAIV